MNIYLCGQKAFGRAVLDMILEEGHQVLGVSAPLTSSQRPDWPDKLRERAASNRLPLLPPGFLNADRLPEGVDLIIAAHSHDFIGRKTRHRAALGAIGYHPSLLPRHRGRDAIRWTLKMGDPVSGGTVYWLSDNMDGGDIAAQEHVFIRPGDTPPELWRRDLFPMGVELFRRTIRDLERGKVVRVPQDEDFATWEPSWERAPVRRPDLLMIGSGSASHTVCRDRAALLQGG